ncbi:MAG: lipoyl(octanoyl) transferase LipB [Chloroflexi bacterium]|nr:MAG: lipoyl(octanoyl) transferase LipB [Chloroflexota bacterium]TMG20132.1 MAG: lipoyl(octanoyl) transferase LipB [Chloroflexota bacterium]
MEVRRLGLVPYPEAWALQNRLADARRAGLAPDTLILLEHPHTYTIGRSGTRDHVFLTESELAARGITCLDVDRGGDVTYHGPGQLVGYPIFDLGPQPDVGRYLRNLEDCLIETLADFGIAAGRLSGYTGVWIGDRKIAAIGVKVSQGVTTHGFALNVSTDLSLFTHILPCGIPDKGVTSMALEVGRAPAMTEVEARVMAHFSNRFAVPETIAAHVA